jgi:hypothetical protein
LEKMLGQGISFALPGLFMGLPVFGKIVVSQY